MAKLPEFPEQPGYGRLRDLIRRDIIDGRIAPGAHLKVGQLAARYETSTIPVREALQRVRRELEQVRYGRPGILEEWLSAQETSVLDERKEAVRADVHVVIREISRRVRWQTRIAAYCWPSSERRRQRSSMRFMNPGPAGRGASGASSASASDEERPVKAE